MSMESVEVVSINGYQGLQAKQPISEGTLIGVFAGPVLTTAHQYSLQVSEDKHVDSPTLLRYLNHSCDPNVRFAFLEGVEAERADASGDPALSSSLPRLVALRDITVGEPITFNYNSTEWHMEVPFSCNCGGMACSRQVQGYSHLDHGQRASLRPLVAPHIKRLEGKAE